MSDEALTYLQGHSQGAKRDMIARFYYEVAQGDPKSGPVAFAVLLNASAEQFARTPLELREANEYFRLLLGQARDFERKMLDRVETSNATVILSFKDETHRAREAWQETLNQAEYVRERARHPLRFRFVLEVFLNAPARRIKCKLVHCLTSIDRVIEFDRLLSVRNNCRHILYGGMRTNLLLLCIRYARTSYSPK